MNVVAKREYPEQMIEHIILWSRAVLRAKEKPLAFIPIRSPKISLKKIIIRKL